MVDTSLFPRRLYESSINRASLINEVAEIGRSERKRRRACNGEAACCVRTQGRKGNRRGAFSHVSRSWVASGSQSHARSVNCRQLTRYTSRRPSHLALAGEPPPYRLYSGSPPSFLTASARTLWRAAVNHRSRFCRHNATSSPLIVTKSTPRLYDVLSTIKTATGRAREWNAPRESINLCTDFFGQAANVLTAVWDR